MLPLSCQTTSLSVILFALWVLSEDHPCRHQSPHPTLLLRVDYPIYQKTKQNSDMAAVFLRKPTDTDLQWKLWNHNNIRC